MRVLEELDGAKVVSNEKMPSGTLFVSHPLGEDYGRVEVSERTHQDVLANDVARKAFETILKRAARDPSAYGRRGVRYTMMPGGHLNAERSPKDVVTVRVDPLEELAKDAKALLQRVVSASSEDGSLTRIQLDAYASQRSSLLSDYERYRTLLGMIEENLRLAGIAIRETFDE